MARNQSTTVMLWLVAAVACSTPAQANPAAAEDFQTYCAPCHGPDAKGGGPASAALKIAPPDLTAIAARHGGTFPHAMIFETITGLDMPDSHGSRDMPVWGDRFVAEAVGDGLSIEAAKRAAAEAEARIEHLVQYLESIQVK